MARTRRPRCPDEIPRRDLPDLLPAYARASRDGPAFATDYDLRLGSVLSTVGLPP